MNTQYFDNGNGQLISASEFVRENVLDTNGWQRDTKCPNCGKSASERNFDECLGGVINQVYSINCQHCGFHECDQEFCSICESMHDERIEASKTELEKDMDDGNSLTLMGEYAIEQVANNGFVAGKEITNIKLLLMKNPFARNYCDIEGIFPSNSAKEAIYLIKRKMLDVKFNRNLEVKIAKAKIDLA